jgi:decaprenylphospho-beta-D-erythro-pentofuranosid-2-ulose 2-reductase
MNKILIVGGTSAIACGVAREYANQGAKLFLLGRNRGRLENVVSDLKVRGAEEVAFAAGDLVDSAVHERLLATAWETFGGFDVALVAYGSLPDQSACEGDPRIASASIQVNFVSAVSWLLLLAGRFQSQGHGTIAAISSVAGDRGRQSNFVYGSAKSGLTTFLEGLRNRLYRSGIRVLTVKPGFVATPMTAHLRKTALFAEPDAVGRTIVRAIARGRDVVYVPWFWRGILCTVRHIPEKIFKRLSL